MSSIDYIVRFFPEKQKSASQQQQQTVPVKMHSTCFFCWDTPHVTASLCDVVTLHCLLHSLTSIGLHNECGYITESMSDPHHIPIAEPTPIPQCGPCRGQTTSASPPA